MMRIAGYPTLRRFGGLLPLLVAVACDSPSSHEPGGPPPEPVAATVEIQAPAGQLEAGQVVTLSARVLAADGAVLNRTVTWSSSDTQVVSVSPAGVLTARAGGSAEVTAAHGTITARIDIVVRQVDAVASVEIEVPFAELAPGQSVALVAKARAANGAVLERDVVWATNNPAVATISDDGVLTARGEGLALITASAGGRHSMVVVTVRSAPPGTVSGLLPASVRAGSPGFELTIRGTGFQPGATVRLGAEARPARVISATEIRIDMTAEDVRHAGGLEVRVWNPGQALGSNSAFFIIEHVPTTDTYDLVGLNWPEVGLPVMTGGFHEGGDITRYVEQFVTAGVLRIHQPPVGPKKWDMTLTMVTKNNRGDVVREENLVFFGTVEYPAPDGHMALRSDMFHTVVLRTLSYYNGNIVVFQSLHPSGGEAHEKAWLYRPRR